MPKRLAALVLGLFISGCAYHGATYATIDNPLVRKWAWFSYLDGFDLREGCLEGSTDRFRLVYNGQYEKQVRTYEITKEAAGGGYIVARSRSGSPDLTDWRLQDPFQPWRWRKSEDRLEPEEMTEFVSLMRDSGLGEPTRSGTRLHSHDFYWVAASCQGGVFAFQAWTQPGGHLDRARFQDFVLAFDKTGVPFRAAYPVPMQEKIVTGRRKGENPPEFFVLTVDDDGIGGLINAF